MPSTAKFADKKNEEEKGNNDNSNNIQTKASAFGTCYFRSLLSLLPSREAGAVRYDERTPDFEGVALEFNPSPPNPSSPFGVQTLESAEEAANDYGQYLQKLSKFFPPEKNWHGFEFNICRAHFVDRLLLDAIDHNRATNSKSDSSSSTSTSPSSSSIRQIVFCGIGQDYRGMRHGKAIAKHGAKVFEMDLAAMIKSRQIIKKEIRKRKTGSTECLPETYELVIDFSTQRVSEVLLACPAFDPTIPTLYIWEGVSYYLTPDSMRNFFVDIHKLMMMTTTTSTTTATTAAGEQKHHNHHRIFFDHLIDLPRLIEEEDDIPAKAMLETFSNSEPLMSFLDFDQVEKYLHDLGFRIYQQLLPENMYTPYQQADTNSLYRPKESKYFGMVVAGPTNK